MASFGFALRPGLEFTVLSLEERIVNPYSGVISPGALLMPEIVTEPISPSCYHLFPGPESGTLNSLLLIVFRFARTRERFAKAGRATLGVSAQKNSERTPGISLFFRWSNR